MEDNINDEKIINYLNILEKIQSIINNTLFNFSNSRNESRNNPTVDDFDDTEWVGLRLFSIS